MSRHFLILFWLFLASLTWTFGQTHDQEPCGTMDLDQMLRENDLTYKVFRKTQERPIESLTGFNKAGTVIQIPVVFHIIYRLDEQNIGEDQIQSQLDVLNKDFNKLNWDTMFVPATWKSIIANCEIKFVKADRDPDGNRTNGITRTKTSIQDIGAVFGSLHFQTVPPWDRDEYLNIWVCEVESGIYGFATFPGAPANKDGLVIDFDCFGTMGTAKAPTDKGRTATHEIGHWLNLLHLWGDPPCGTDFVDDTPVQNNGNYKCPKYPDTSCNNAPHGDMFVNYMDYVDDKCMNMFTEGQKIRMLATLNGSRSSLLSSKGYNGIGESILDRGIDVYPNPVNQFLTIRLKESLPALEIKLFNAHGVLALSKSIEPIKQEIKIDVSEMNEGMYILQILAQGSQRSEKVIIEHH